MTDQTGASTSDGITVRYWAGARAAAGVASETVPLAGAATLADVLASVRSMHADNPRFGDVVTVCSVLVGDRPVGTADPASVVLRPGDTVELLPPFAGG
ncbi:MAG TPA: MoaD/ThiS family protein [Nocardioidaceae bacterium]|jgi:molybdopterin converting factor small subunit|nr:MoaD/ThiS family protein [Nocardioidaceae bacterium]